jgi:hypothetical protein
MNQQIEDALGGFEPTPDNIRCAVQILTHQAALSSAEYAMLLRPNAEPRAAMPPVKQLLSPRPKAERRLRDLPITHAGRRGGE